MRLLFTVEKQHERHIDIIFLRKKGRLPRDDEERKRFCIAHNLIAQTHHRPDVRPDA